jgi:hypothetical protein
MQSRFIYLFVMGLAGPCLAVTAAEKQPLVYDRDVRPILSENCFPCHGQDSKKRMAGLRLDSFEGATADRGGHAAMVPGKPELSLMYQKITAQDKARRMPPPFSNRTLTAEQIATLTRWIQEGGVYTQHWAFVSPKEPVVPKDVDTNWVKQPIDAFVYKRLEGEHLQPSKPANPATWLRRVSLDLTGLPPSLTDLDSFSKEVEARGEKAYIAAVDRLLASPRYGERMAQDWLDVARYADTNGFNNDSSREMWRWRDWVIQSFNDNMPYDRFLTDQLAGDMLPNPTLEQRIASGFNRNHVINSEGGIIDEEYRVEYVADRVVTFSQAWMGLTVGCARCHDHKFDPITQRDYYRFYTFFNNVPEMGEDARVANAVPTIQAPTKEQQQKAQQLEAAISNFTARVENRERAAKLDNRNAQRALALAHGLTPIPTGTALRITCDSDNEFEKRPENGFSLAEGVVGHSCITKDTVPKPQTAGKSVPVSKRQPLTFSAWVRPDAADNDVALLSTMNYDTNPASVAYGEGLDLRLVSGELEFRFADRFPAYSICVQSKGAKLVPGQWRHVTAVYKGVIDKDAMRAKAASVQLFVDGREVPVQVIVDDLALPDASDDKPTLRQFRIGWDNNPKSNRFQGRFDEMNVWPRALTSAEIYSLFEKQAIPYAVARQQAQQSSPSETEWLKETELEATNRSFVQEEQKLDGLRAELLALRRAFPSSMVMEEMSKPRETHILARGTYNAPGEKVEAGVPEKLLGAWPEGVPKNRLGLAQWLTKADNPLTSRVVVNRFWQQLFGEGLVKTSDNFGMQGEWPSHPELLDWLSIEFVSSGWNVKALMKQIVLSATYRQDSAASPELIERDPENRLLARGPRVRLPAETIRDQALQISGLLKNRLGGASVYPYQPEGLYKGIVVAASYPGTKYVPSTGDDLYRRSLYTFWKRTVPHPTMAVFDAPDREVCVVRRAPTNTPLQALTLLNDPIFVEAARKLAERSIREGGASADARLEFAFRLATGRKPDSEEEQILRKKLDEMLAAFRGDTSGANSLVTVGASPRDPSIPVGELAAYTAVTNMILNLDEVITNG